MYWLIFLTVSVLVALSLLFMSGTLDGKKNSEKNVAKTTVGDKNTQNIVKKKTESDNSDIAKQANSDLLNSKVDFESDPEDFSDNTDDVKELDDSSQAFDSIDSEIY